MGVYELSGAGSVKTGRTLYTSMNAGNQYGAMVPIATRDFTTGAIDFTNIPQTYQDLMVVAQLRGTNASTDEYLLTQFNGSSTGHSWTTLLGDGSSVSTSCNSPGGIAPGYFYCGLMPGGNSTAGLYSTPTMHILNYANTSTNKTAVWRFGADRNGSGQTSANVALFASTAGINRIFMLGSNGTSGAATLYGIRAVSS